ncbi:unnamed protein product [Gongylonema pulchrum]|uniref:Alpha-1,6-mannosyl-glycoprotein 2-beta-N-acetylglucosaminyltransferase n=1 Tax=Gongylonema pulchrum TaxID=637853 RepID=A0A183ED33_9BILA|nr:unnamed protein product [Gongylonema pulchrum]
MLQMNYVFDGVLKQYGLTKAWVILLEEDHYVSPDFLHVMRLIVNNKLEYCAECQVISLGLYLKRYNNFAENLDRLGIHPWFSSKHNMGMAINSSTWALIKNCTKVLSTKCLPTRLRVIVVKAPRVLHVGDCGVHTHRCAARELFENVADSLFPEKMKVVERMTRTMKPSKENGGWGDTRDHELCLNNSHVPDLAAYDFYLRSSAGALNNNNSIASRNVSHSVIVRL